MDLVAIREAKIKLASDIRDLLQAFSDTTTLVVNDITIESIQHKEMKTTLLAPTTFKTMYSKVDLDVKL